MPRKPRVHLPSSMHHITANAVDGRVLFEDDEDRWRFIGILGDVTREVDWRCLGFCLMGTHYHLLLQEESTPLWRGMRLVNGRFATAFNARHAREGHLFGGRYHDEPVESDQHLLATIRYIARNPVDAGLCERPQDWPWSTYAQLVGLAPGWSFVSTAWTLSLFSPKRDDSIRRVRDFVEQVPGT